MARMFAALLRHGDYKQLPDTPSAWQPFPLNETGEQQARKAADPVLHFARRQGLHIHPDLDCSNLQRAWQTAQLLADGLRSDLGTAPHLSGFDTLSERSVGSAANLCTAQIEAILDADPRYARPPKGWKSDSNYRLPFPGAESLMEAGDRCANHIEHRMLALQRSEIHDTLKIFVGHGAAFRHAAFLMGVLSFDRIAELSMHHAQPLFFELTNEGRWLHSAGEWKQRRRSETALD